MNGEGRKGSQDSGEEVKDVRSVFNPDSVTIEHRRLVTITMQAACCSSK